MAFIVVAATYGGALVAAITTLEMGGVSVGGEGRVWPGNKCVKHKDLGNTHGRKTVSAVSLRGHGSCGLVGLEQL